MKDETRSMGSAGLIVVVTTFLIISNLALAFGRLFRPAFTMTILAQADGICPASDENGQIMTAAGRKSN